MEPALGIAALRARTAEVHRALDAELHLAQPGATRDTYLAYVAAMWGWLSPFEAALWAPEWPAELEAAERDGKRAWLEADLRASGLDDRGLAVLPRSPLAPPLETPSQRLGVAYVIEGAQLGGRVLLERLGPVLAPLPARWLQGYGPQLGARWAAFRAVVERELDTADKSDDAAAAARVAFEQLARWLRERGVAGRAL